MGIAQHLIYNIALGVGKVEVGGIKGSVATVGALPVGADNGDIYIVEADGHGYSWNGTLWTDIGLFRGPQGPQGPQGIQGDTGPAGPTLHSGLTDAQGGTTGEHYHLTNAQHQNLPATITAAGAALLDDADAAAQRTTLGLGTAAVADVATVVQQADIGTAPNQVPLNQYLGGMAYQDPAAVNITGGKLDNVEVSDGVVNGVTYLNSNKTLTSSNALTFDGTKLRTIAQVYVNSDANYLAMVNAADTEYRGRITQNGSDIEFFNRQAGGLVFGAYDTEQMRLTGTGLWIGTSSAINGWNYQLQLNGYYGQHVAANCNLEIINPNMGEGIRLFARNDAGALNRLELQGGQVIFPLTTGADGVYFDAASGKLEVVGTVTTPTLQLTTQAAGLTTPQQGVFELIGNSLQFTNLAKRRSVAQTATVLTAGIDVTNTVTETSLITSHHGANYLESGKCEEIVLRGVIGKATNDVLTLTVKYAGVAVITLPVDAAAITTGTAIDIRVIATCRTIGATGTMQINVNAHIDGRTNPPDTRALVTINTTTAATLELTAKWSTASTADTLTIDHGRVLCIDGSK